MEAEGVAFRTGTRVGDARYGFGLPVEPETLNIGGEAPVIIAPKDLENEYDLILVTIGAREPRELDVPGRSLAGIFQALDFLSRQNRLIAGETAAGSETSVETSVEVSGTTAAGAMIAYGKRVLVIGGGDTGADCVGTANRQGAKQVTQIELLPRPPEHRPDEEPWPLWPKVLKTSSSHLEGGERLWSVKTRAFSGNGKVEAAQVCKVQWTQKDGRWTMTEVPDSGFEIAADIVLLAMGFTHVVQGGLVAGLGLETDERGNIRTRGSFHTSNPKVWAAGDSRNGASLVVRAIADGRAAAEAIQAHFRKQ
jgi:glutamate synthase (NADPH/NADH) small chain